MTQTQCLTLSDDAKHLSPAMKASAFFLIPFMFTAVVGVRPAEAEPKSGNSGCTSQGKSWGELSKSQCSACGGKWTVSDTGCGGGVIASSLATLGGLLTANPIAIAGGIFGMVMAKKQCDGKCEQKV